MQKLLWEHPKVKKKFLSPKLTEVERNMVARYSYGESIKESYLRANSRSIESAACQKWQKVNLWHEYIQILELKPNKSRYEGLIVEKTNDYKDEYDTYWTTDLIYWNKIKSGNPCENITRLTMIKRMWELLDRTFWINALNVMIDKEKDNLRALKEKMPDYWSCEERTMLKKLRV